MSSYVFSAKALSQFWFLKDSDLSTFSTCSHHHHIRVTFSCSFEKVNKSPSKIKCSNHISWSTITYTVYIYLYKYIHKYLTCTTNFEKGGRENPKDLMRTCGGGGRWDRVGGPMLPAVAYRAFPFKLYTLVHTQPFKVGVISIGPVGGAAIVGLAALGLLLHAVRLTALTWTPLQEKSNKFSHHV